jgi:hypothetical protein
MTSNRLAWSIRLIAVIGAMGLAFAPAAVADDDAAYNGAPTVVSGGPVPTMNGIPCVGGNLGLCTGFAQNQPSRNPPQSYIGGTPTIRN